MIKTTTWCSGCQKQVSIQNFFTYKSGPRAGKPLQRCKECHAAYYKRQRDARRALGLCASCGNDANGKALCEKCEDRRKRSRASRAGLPCNVCHQNPRSTDGHYCVECRSAMYKAKRDKIKNAVFDHYGRSCECCGETLQAFLSIDHIEGGGLQHRKSLGISSSTGFYAWLRKSGFPTGFRTLCHNCNMGRQINGGVCPHQIAV